MIIIAETKQENELVEKLAKEHHSRAIKREDGYAVTVWSVDDVVGCKDNVTKEAAEQFLEFYENRLKDSVIDGGSDFIRDADYSGFEQLPETVDEYEIVEVCGKHMLFTNSRIRSWQVPDGLFLYHLRESDDGDRFCSIEKSVGVNHGGSVLSKEPIDLGPLGFIFFTEDTEPNFTGVGDVSIEAYVTDLNATFISIWDNGTQIMSPCKVNLATREVFDIQPVDAPGVDILIGEDVQIGEERFSVSPKDEADLEAEFWRK